MTSIGTADVPSTALQVSLSMPGWLTKATNAIGSTRSDEPQPFAVRCGCGTILRGQRSARFREAVCPDCGSRSFVLPIDTYPQLRPKSTRRRKRRKSGKKRHSAPRASVGEALAGTVTAAARSAVLGGRAAGTATVSSLNRGVQRTRAFFTPIRLVMIAMVMVVLATAVAVTRKRGEEEAIATLRDAGEAGFAAIAADDYPAAAVEFRQAAEAARRLGRGDERTRRIFQMERVTTAITELSPDSPVRMMDDAERDFTRSLGADWCRRFASLYGERWIIVDAPVYRTVAADGREMLRVDYPLLAGDRPLRLEIDGSAFSGMQIEEPGRRIVFAARFASARLTPPPGRAWVITLDADSVFLWSDFDNLAAAGLAGFDPRGDDLVRELLADQSRRMGLTP